MLFSALNVPCTHERVFRPRACLHEVLKWHDDRDKAESSWLAWAFLPILPEAIPVLHTTRDPWQVIDSLANRNDLLPVEATVDAGKQTFRDAIRWLCPRVFQHEKTIDRAAALVIEWNNRIESTVRGCRCPYRRYRVEDVNAELVTNLLEWLGIFRDSVEIENALQRVPRNVNGGRQIDYNVEVKNPLVRAYLQEVMPDREPVINRVLSVTHKRPAEELASEMDADLADEVRQLAARYGYENKNEGVKQHDSCNECATV